VIALLLAFLLAPTNLKCEVIGETHNLTWEYGGDAVVTFKVETSVDGNYWWPIALTPQKSYTVSKFFPNARVQLYRVRSFDGTNFSEPSNVVRGVVPR
jgi:hypothetical protein